MNLGGSRWATDGDEGPESVDGGGELDDFLGGVAGSEESVWFFGGFELAVFPICCFGSLIFGGVFTFRFGLGGATDSIFLDSRFGETERVGSDAVVPGPGDWGASETGVGVLSVAFGGEMIKGVFFDFFFPVRILIFDSFDFAFPWCPGAKRSALAGFFVDSPS